VLLHHSDGKMDEQVMGVDEIAVHGTVAPGFEAVADAFAQNLSERGEHGAAFSVVIEDVTVVDLWGGMADATRARPWSHDTLQLIFSGTKGLVATCLLMLIDRGELSLDEPVCRWWPEFAAEGKDTITVAEVVSHRARLPAIAETLTEDDLLDGVELARRLARQAPERDPRAAAIYHPLTYGWICGELVRRITGRSVGRFFADEVAGPLGLDLWIGLPAELEPRVSELAYGPDFGIDARRPATDPLLTAIYDNPPLFPPTALPWNAPRFHTAEIPGANAIGSARSVARLYAALTTGRLTSDATVRLGRTELSRFTEPSSGEPLAFGAGFQLQTHEQRYGPPMTAFGHTGTGGSVHGAWPEQGLGFSYTMNELRDARTPDPRAQALLKAVWRAL
jgi:CubicO group peptidase (beta-lactamase class C family)